MNLRTGMLAVAAVGALASGQTGELPEFEVASIRLAAPSALGTLVEFVPSGRVNLTNMTLKGMIVFAWDAQPFQISGGAPWLDSVRYDVTAQPGASAKRGDIRVMLQALLADRFQLRIRHTAKQLPIYRPVVARKGKLGPGLTESKLGSCMAFDPAEPRGRPEPGAAPRRVCGNMSQSRSGLSAIGVPVAKLVAMLTMTLGRTVVDMTGLTGIFYISMKWSPDETQAFQYPPDTPKPAQSDAAGPWIFTAIQEQLGLKLESARGPVDLWIVDRAEKPSEN